jgi:aspartate-semialdehyde dehydrogenase
MSYNIAIVGATGLVGFELIKLLENSNISINTLKLFASTKSINKKITFRNNTYLIQSLKIESLKNIDFVFFAAGAKISKKFIPQLKKLDIFCIDLSSAYRMEKNAFLVIPEINGNLLNKQTKLIASPNCTTTIMLMALCNLHKKLTIKKIITSTYQAASGGGKKLIDKLIKDTKNSILNKENINSYGFNLFLHESPLNENKYSSEEIKIINETHKILDYSKIKINVTCVRVPVIRAHSLAVNVEFEKKFSLSDIYEIIKQAKNVKIFEDYQNNRFATPKDASYKKEILISRIRKDISNPSAIDIWICGDQLLKGAAFNAFQILEKLICILENK